MRTLRQDTRRTAGEAGQTIYQTMLIISCVALALAIFFPVYEIFDLYRGPIKTAGGSTMNTYSPPAPAPTAEPEPDTDTDTEAEASEPEGDTGAPDAGNASEPSDEPFAE